ncbi:MAG: transcription termination/antitermination NusG family protein [Verrucomicrobiae bacterium]|nr:transcription termination/antitermination NusG family protein [Verrucomicrobiae bacterium]
MHDSTPAWFCLRSQPKHEHIAAAHLRQMPAVDVFVPRIRFKRLTRYGQVSVTEALFPNYLFARFDWHDSLRRIYHSPGVSEVVHFGTHWPVIPDEVIDSLRSSLGHHEVHEIPDAVSPGDPVQIVGGSLHGLHAVVSRVMPGTKRVAVLMDFLGRQSTIELEIGKIIKETGRQTVLR